MVAVNFLVNVGLVVGGAVLLLVGAAAESAPLIYLSILCSLVAFCSLVVAARIARRREASGAVPPAAPAWPRTETTAAVADEAPTAVVSRTPAAETTPERREPAPAAAGARRPRGRPAFPIEGYDDMRVREILPLLDDLDADELALVAEREEQGKRRQTLLSRIDRRLEEAEPVEAVGASPAEPEAEAPFPIEGYDRMPVRDILPRLDELDDDELDLVREREAQGRKRPTVLRGIALLSEERRAGAEPELVPEPDAQPRTAAATGVPIEGYDDLSLGQVLAALDTLDDDGLRRVAEHEHHGARRAVIINKIESLVPGVRRSLRATPVPRRRGATRTRPAPPPPPAVVAAGEVAPIEGYDRMRTTQVVPLLDDLDGETLEAVRDYEAETKNRPSVLRRIDQLLGQGAEAEGDSMPTIEMRRVGRRR